MRNDGLLAPVAEALGLELVSVFGGGELGAALVRDRQGADLVLKVLPGAEWADRFARGTALAGRLRSPDYPVPRYAGTGVHDGVSWSLQERLPGSVPDVMTAAHARRLVGLAGLHAGAAGRRGDVRARLDQELDGVSARLAGVPEVAALARDLTAAHARDVRGLRDGGVVHGDFHHRNFLAVGDRVTGLFDWELAWAGDWRFDLVTLACWASWVPEQFTPEARRVAVDAAESECEPGVLALFAAHVALRTLDFDARTHPDRLPGLAAAVAVSTRAWLPGR